MAGARASLLVLFLSLLLTSCMSDSENLSNLITTPFDNIPVVVNTLNAYTFTLNANEFSETRSENLSFNTDSLVITLTLGNHSAGGGSLTVAGSDSSEIFSESLDRNKVVIRTDVNGHIPKTISVTLIDFTGSVSLVLAQKKE